jgi:anionic cell wall polymer biosynthesis LytR-Cps2A-Psr (LCP) family protein
MNEVYLYELNCIYWHSTGRDYLPEKSGTYHLNGKQTLAYTRVRYVGGGDFGRTERQRKVIAELMKKVKSMSAKRLSSFAERCLHYVTTNISQKEVMSMALHGAEYLGYEQVNARIPIDKTHHSERLQGTYVLIIDLQKNADYWYNLVYLDKDITEDIYKAIEKEKAEAAAKKKADKEAKKADEDFLKLAAEAAAIAGVKVSASDSTVTESSQ